MLAKAKDRNLSLKVLKTLPKAHEIQKKLVQMKYSILCTNLLNSKPPVEGRIQTAAGELETNKIDSVFEKVPHLG